MRFVANSCKLSLMGNILQWSGVKDKIVGSIEGVTIYGLWGTTPTFVLEWSADPKAV